MSAISIRQMADRVAELMDQRLRVRGKSLSEKLRRGGRLLPRRVRTAARKLAEAAEAAQNPRLLVQLDMQEVARNYDLASRYLGDLGAGARRLAALLDWLARLAFILLVAGGMVIGVMYWRGFLGQ